MPLCRVHRRLEKTSKWGPACPAVSSGVESLDVSYPAVCQDCLCGWCTPTLCIFCRR